MMLETYLLDWLHLGLRWAHIITGIAWIGSSFYFIWLDARLNVPPKNPESPDIAGDLWAVHGGGFYHAQKYKLAPAELPEPLHWFKWEAYSTWVTGFLLLAVVYYTNAEALLIDPRVFALTPAMAIGASLSLLPIGWWIYDGLSRLALPGRILPLIGALLMLGLCFGVCRLYGGRGAYLQVGVMLGTIMVANVWRVIIPSQKALVAAKLAGVEPDARLGQRAKQRSVHNNYLTLPVVFTMLSPHFALTWSHEYNWLILFLLFAIGALIRHGFNLRNQGRQGLAPWLAALGISVVLVVVLLPRDKGTALGTGAPDPAIAYVEVHRIIHARCIGCHSATPTHPMAPLAAAGVLFDTPREIQAWAPRIYERVVATRTMPLANLTGMTDDERAVIGRWYENGAPTD